MAASLYGPIPDFGLGRTDPRRKAVPSGGSFLEDNPGVTAGIAGLGSYLSGLGQQNQITQQGKAGVAEYKANNAQSNFDKDRADQLARSSQVAAMDPLGSSQMYAGKMALIKNLLSKSAPVHSTPGDSGVAGAMGSRTGINMPSLDPAMLENLFGDASTQTSIAQRQKQMGRISPDAPMFDLSSIYGKSADGSQNAFDTDIQSNAKDAGDDMAYEKNLSRQAVMKAIAEMQEAAKGPSKTEKFLGALPSIGSLALGFL